MSTIMDSQPLYGIRPFYTPRLAFHPIVASDAEGIHAIRGREEVMKWSIRKAPDPNLEFTRDWMLKFTDPRHDGQGLHVGFSIRERLGRPGQNGDAALDDEVDSDAQIQKGRIIGTLGCRLEAKRSSASSGQEEGEDGEIGAESVSKSTEANGSAEEENHPEKLLFSWEIGYVFHPDVWGKGYATESLKGFLGAWGAIRGMLLEGEKVAEAEKAKMRAAMGGLGADTDVSNEASKRVLMKCGFVYMGEDVDRLGTVCAQFRHA